MAGYSNRGGGISDLASIVDGVTVVVNGAGKLESVGGAVPDGSVTMAKLANLATMSVIGRAAAGTGVPAAITAVTDGHAFRLNGTTIGWGTLAAGAFADNTIAPARLTNAAGAGILGRSASGAGAHSLVALAGVSGHVPVDQGDGTWAWAAQSGGGGGGFTPGGAERVPFGDAAGTALEDDAGLTYDKATFALYGQGASLPRLVLDTTGGSQVRYSTGVLAVGVTQITCTTNDGNLVIANNVTIGNFGIQVTNFQGMTGGIGLPSGTAPTANPAANAGFLWCGSGLLKFRNGTDVYNVDLTPE